MQACIFVASLALKVTEPFVQIIQNENSQDKMMRVLPVLLTVLAGVMVTSAMKCSKIILEGTTTGEARTKDVMEKGRYLVETIELLNPKLLVSVLSEASDIKINNGSFTAILQPSDLKKVPTCIPQ